MSPADTPGNPNRAIEKKALEKLERKCRHFNVREGQTTRDVPEEVETIARAYLAQRGQGLDEDPARKAVKDELNHLLGDFPVQGRLTHCLQGLALGGDLWLDVVSPA